eukprot:TRINITY_DN1073_c0_g1_i1.p1 TRINITY_DN1073_c0_g1~~TRINITY_DN1073_c0_g1_i1.p1  ORF type:complete len:266 (-),score=51.72 TRINITY_DN1073_c0_g1_i1:3108-3905(-)
MAFVITPNALLRTTAFRGDVVSQRPVTHTSRVRMAVKEDPDSLWTSVGKTSFKENIFTGGMPGGEAFYKAWVEDGMKKDFPDVPEKFQPKAAYKPKKEVKTGLLATLDKTEFFKGFTMPTEDEELEDAQTEQDAPATDDSEAPSPLLYEKYFPAYRLHKAPEIKIVFENDYLLDSVSVAMTEVTASATDLYYPKETKNKAPVIDVSYNGSLAMASVSVSLKLIEGLPTLPPPPKAEGDIITSLVPGSGGGLKLQFEAAGQGEMNV